MIDAIYASKLYKTSNRRSKIHAAFEDSSNQGLVTQLVSYLDEPYRDLAEEQPKEEEKVKEEVDVEEKGDSENDNNSLPDSLNPGLGPDFSPKDNLVHIDEEVSDLEETSDSTDEAAPNTEPVEESTQIKASTGIEVPTDVIKGSLNSVEDTKGVERIQVKESELWIYYNDEVNLNNIMTNVIEYLNASGRTNLEFNRLARSDNAIVFVINREFEQLKTVTAVED